MTFKNIDFIEWKNNFNPLQVNEELIFGCGNDRLDIVKYVLTSPELKIHANVNWEIDSPLRIACGRGHIQIIDYLLNSPDLKFHASHELARLSIIEKAAYDGQLNVLKYFLNHPKFEFSALKQINKDVLAIASGHGFLDMVTYLLTEPKFKNFIDLHSDNDRAFRHACTNEQMEIIKFFIFDMNIEKTTYIDNWLLTGESDIAIEVKKLFEIRELTKGLNTELDENKSSKMKAKI
jgi:ankyrin repeat protein